MVAVNMIIHMTIILACAERACSAYQECSQCSQVLSGSMDTGARNKV